MANICELLINVVSGDKPKVLVVHKDNRTPKRFTGLGQKARGQV
jgi:hypothetical protein